MFEILKIIFIIFLILYLLIVFVMWGFVLGEVKDDEDEDLSELGLSKAALNYERESTKTKLKLIGIFLIFIFGPYLAIRSIIEGDYKNISPKLKRFSIW